MPFVKLRQILKHFQIGYGRLVQLVDKIKCEQDDDECQTGRPEEGPGKLAGEFGLVGQVGQDNAGVGYRGDAAEVAGGRYDTGHSNGVDFQLQSNDNGHRQQNCEGGNVSAAQCTECKGHNADDDGNQSSTLACQTNDFLCQQIDGAIVNGHGKQKCRTNQGNKQACIEACNNGFICHSADTAENQSCAHGKIAHIDFFYKAYYKNEQQKNQG